MKKIILINFFAVLLIIFFLEIIIRLLNIVELQGFNKQDFYFENGIIFSKPNNFFKVSGVNSRTDNNGFRIPINNFSYDKDKSFTLILGDSVTFGVGVEEKKTFIGILRDNSKNVNLYNSAIFGHNIESYLYILKKNQKKFKKEINRVVIFLCLNDVIPYQGTIFGNNFKEKENDLKKKIVKNTIALKVNVFLRERSALFVFLKGMITDPIKRHYDYMEALYSNKKNLLEFEKNITEITDFMIKNNLSYEYVLLPYSHQVRNDCKKELLKPQEMIESIFKNQNLNLRDYTHEFCKVYDKNDLFLKYDPVHLSKYGHKYVSDLLILDKVF